MKLKILTIITTVAILLQSCFQTTKVINVNETIKKGNSLIYNLPETGISLQIELSKISKYKGPFYQYAHNYFEVKKIIKEDESVNKITNIVFKEFPKIDSSQFYCVYPSKSESNYFISLTKEGFIKGINSQNTDIEIVENKTGFYSESEIQKPLSYADYSINPLLETQYDTTYKEIYKDSAFVKIPIITKQLINKTSEKQAKELADQIFLLRDDRNALLKGENDGGKVPDGDALLVMLKELNTLEKEYMSLFMGKTEDSKNIITLNYIPKRNEAIIRDTLFYFSEKEGVVIENSDESFPVIIKITPIEDSKYIEKYQKRILAQTKSNKTITDGIAYRIPKEALVEIYFGNKLVADKTILIAQFGTIHRLPNDIFKEKIKVDFFPELGSLKSISEN